MKDSTWRHNSNRLRLICIAFLAATPAVWARDIPPTVPSPSPVTVAAPMVRTLANGLEVVLLENHHLPIVTLTLAIKTGAEADPPHLPGTAQFAASLLNEGTRTRSAQQIAAAIDVMGGAFDSAAEWDDSWATLSTLRDHAQQAFALLSDMVINPAFAPAEIARLRRQTVSALDILQRDPGYLAGTLAERMIFLGTPYSHPADGVVQSVRRISRSELRQFHDLYYQPSNAILMIAGDISATQAFSLAQSSFSGWKGSGPLPPSSAKPPAALTSRQIIVIDDPNAVQTVIRIADLAVRRASPEYDALTVANQVLGGPAENRLFTVLRSRYGLVYGASSNLLYYRSTGAWEMKTSTRTAETVKTVRLILVQMKRLRAHAISPAELRNAEDYLVGHRDLEFETSQQIAEHILDLMIYDLPMDTLNREPQKLRSLTTEDVLEATRSTLTPYKAVIVLVGNARGFEHDLKSLGQVRIIPMADVDFASATLERSATEATANK